MKIEPGNYTLHLSRAELIALSRGLDELDFLRTRHPGERNGFDVNTASKVDAIHSQIAEALRDSR